jgi:hypothetical protein
MFKCINNLAPEYLCSNIVLVLPLAGKFVADLVGQFQKLKTNVTH